MALPLLALGKIVSGVVSGAAKGLTVAGKATAKGAAVTAETIDQVASVAGKGLGKAVAATARGFGKVASSTGKGVKTISKSMSNIGKGKSKSTKITRIRKTAKKIKKSIIEYNKKSKKLRLNQERMRRNMLERQKQRSKEKKLESKKGPFQNALKSVTGAPMSFMDKLLGFGSLLLTGILVNSLDDITKKFKDFKENNQGLITAVGNIANFIKDSFVSIFDSVTKPFKEEGSFDWLAKFDDNGNLVSGRLKELQDVIKTLAPLVKLIKKLDIRNLDERPRTKSKRSGFGAQGGFGILDPHVWKAMFGIGDENIDYWTPDGEYIGKTQDYVIWAGTPEGQKFLKEQGLGHGPLYDPSSPDFLFRDPKSKYYYGPYDIINKGEISPITPKDKNLGDQSSLGFDHDTTIIVATQPVMQPFPIPYAVPVKSKSKVNNSMVAFNNPLWTGVA